MGRHYLITDNYSFVTAFSILLYKWKQQVLYRQPTISQTKMLKNTRTRKHYGRMRTAHFSDWAGAGGEGRQTPGADPRGGPGGPAPALTLGFEAPKLSIFGPYLIFHNFFFCLTLLSILFL